MTGGTLEAWDPWTVSDDDHGLAHLKSESDVSACLLPLLTAIGWRGDPRHVAQALPHFHKVEDLQRLRAVLANLHYASRAERACLDDLDPRLLPCLFQPTSGPLMILLGREGPRYRVFDGGAAEIREVEAVGQVGTAYFIQAEEAPPKGVRSTAQVGRWCRSVGERFRGLVLQMLAISLFTNLLALAVPVFIMTVYDKVIGSGDPYTLYYLLGGILLALSADAGLRLVRARILAYVAGRIDMIVGTATFQQILHLSVSVTERASLGAQIARLRQFEAIREFFAGPLAGVFLDLPFVAIFLLVIAAIAGQLVWVPIVLIALFVLAGCLIIPILRRLVHEASEARSRKENFLIEMLSELRTIKLCAAEPMWSRRFRQISADSAISGYRTAQISIFVQTIAQSLMLLGGIATLTMGTLAVMDGAMTVGALIACMALVWRVLSPLQTAFLSFTRLEQVTLGLKQIDNLMRQKVEREPGAIVESHRTFDGQIQFERASLRYVSRAEPALLGVSAVIEPGEVVAVTGPNGSGKSSILKLIAGLYEAQSGGVYIDGIDTRHLDTDELRGAISYVPQICDLFHGTIAQNLRLANPTASDKDIAEAAMDAGLMEDILNLPEGFDTRLTDQLQKRLPGGIKQRLMLARAYVKKARVFLMDEPANNLDHQGDRDLMRTIQKLRGRATVLLVTHRPSHMRLADKVLYLEGGRLMLAGPPDQVLPQLGMG